VLSKLVNTLIGIKPIYSVMKVAAKQVLVDTANKNGIPWKQTVKELQSNPEVRSRLAVFILLPHLNGSPLQKTEKALRR